MNSEPPILRSSLPPTTPYKPNWFVGWLSSRFFSHVRVDNTWSETVNEAARRGTVVYIMRAVSVLDFLCLDYLIRRFALPALRFANNLGLWVLEPFGKGERSMRFSRRIPEAAALQQTILARHSALLFLLKRRPLGEPTRPDKDTDLFRALVEAQRQSERPIILLPQIFVWTKRPPEARRRWYEVLFDPSEWPGRLRVLFRFLLNYSNAVLRAGEPFDLGAFMAEHPALTDTEIADKLRFALLRRIEREHSLVSGPRKKSPWRIMDELLRSPRVRKVMESVSRGEKKSMAAVERMARKELRALCAAPSPTVLGMFHAMLERLWTRIYDGLVVDKPGLERVRQAARHSTLVLLPTHKSHLDYLVLSDLFYANDLSTPLIAAGDNLNFFPVGPFLRRAGAFFIRRSFKGRKLYSVLVDAYMRRLLLEGYTTEFFIEGGRSRTGLLLTPKLGLLTMVVDAALLLSTRKVSFVPISISYERVVEQKSYAQELGGAEKQKESLGNLLESRKVLRSRYGRVYVQFGEILDFDELLTRARKDPSSTSREITPPERRQLVQLIAREVSFEMQNATVVTPASILALALLSSSARGMRVRDVTERAGVFLERLRELGAVIAPTLLEEGPVRQAALAEAIELLVSAKLLTLAGKTERIITVADGRRIALEYYKNSILHWFLPQALIGWARNDVPGADMTALLERAKELAKLFRHEFSLPTGAALETLLNNAIERLRMRGELDNRRVLEDYTALLRPHMESLRLVTRSARALGEKRVSRKDWLRETLAIGEEMFLTGEVLHRESLSKPKLENALNAVRELGMVEFFDDQIARGAAPNTEGTTPSVIYRLLPNERRQV